MMRRGTLSLAAMLLVLPIWLLVACAGREGTAGGQKKEDDVGESSIEEQKAQQEESADSEKTVSARPRELTESVELVDVNWNSTLIFQSDIGELWAMNAQGSEPLRLTDEGKPYPTTSLSPNGKKIAYATERIEGGCGGASACASTSPEKSYAQIYVMNSDGSNQTKIVEELGASSSPTWSPDGRKIAFALSGPDDDSCTIFAMNADGSGDRTALTTLDGCYSINSLSWSPDGKKIAYEGSTTLNAVDIWVVDVADEQGETDRPQQLTHTPVGWWNVGPTWSPDSTEIAFTHKATEEYDQSVYKINADGSGETRLTHDLPVHGDPDDPPIDPTYSPMHSPVWSPAGTRIAFVREYRFLENPDRYSGDSTPSSLIYVMGSDGSKPTVVKDLSSEWVSNLDWLPGWVDLPLADPDQAQEARTTSGQPPPSAEGCKPVANSVGEIAYQLDEDIWTMNADGSDPTRLTHDQAKEDTPAFSPDGQKIAFVREVEVEAEGGSLSETPPHLVPKIVVMGVKGCHQKILPLPEGEYAHEPSWSPDGRRIAFWSDPLPVLETCRMFITNADGSGIPRRIPTPGLSDCILRPEWSPDGTQIAFEAGYGDGWADIYVVDVSAEGATSQPRQLIDDDPGTPSDGHEAMGATEPSWSPDGTEIAFVGGQDIYKFDVKTLEETRLTTWEGAGSGTSVEGSPTWSPDGERIAFVRDESDASTSIYVMSSDGSEPTLVRDFPPAERPVPDWRPLP
jgi:Tol biopolymer transport system component